MANTVKLKDGSYIDSNGVYDTTLKKTQDEINQTFIARKLEYNNVTMTPNTQYFVGAFTDVPTGYKLVSYANNHSTGGAWATINTTVSSENYSDGAFCCFMYLPYGTNTYTVSGYVYALFMKLS